MKDNKDTKKKTTAKTIKVSTLYKVGVIALAIVLAYAGGIYTAYTYSDTVNAAADTKAAAQIDQLKKLDGNK